MKNEKIEIIEEYKGGVLIKRTLNGIEQVLPPFEDCISVTFHKTMPREEFEKFYGKYKMSSDAIKEIK